MIDAIHATAAPVLYVNGNLGRGGGEEVCRQLTTHLRQHGTAVDIVNLGPDRDVWATFERQGCTMHQVDLQRDAQAPRSVGQLRSILRSRQPRIVHTIGNIANLYGSLAARSAGVEAIVASEHNTLESWSTRSRSAIAGRLAHRYIAVSDACARSLRRGARVPPRKITVIRNGVDLARLDAARRAPRGGLRARLGIPARVPVVGTIGSLKSQKNYPRWLRVASLVSSAVPQTHFVIIGGGPLEAQLRTSAPARSLGSRLHFVGSAAEGPLLMRDFDVFLLTSDREGFGLALCEAQYLGVPVVATASGGVAEVVRNGETGLLFKPNDEEAMAAACRRLLLEPTTSRAMTEAGPGWVKSAFDGTRMATEVCTAYRDLLDRPGW